MTRIDSYCEKWNLTNPVLLVQTRTSNIYRVQFQNQKAILKLLNAIGQRDEGMGASALKSYNGHGSVRLLKEDPGAHLLEFVEGRYLKDLVVDGHDESATEIICDVVLKLHSYSGPIHKGVISMDAHFRALFSKAKSEPKDSIFVEAAKLAEGLLDSERDPALLHGDIHHKNILESKERGWLAIDPQCLTGDRAYDVANSFFNPDDMPALVETERRIRSSCRIFSDRLDLNPRRILEFAFVHGCLSSAWCLDDGQSPERRLRITRLIRNVLKRSL